MVEIPQLPDDIRATLPSAVQAYISALETAVSGLQTQLGVAQQLVAELQVYTRQTSRNSSRPPSADPPNARPRPHRPSSPRKRGAQPGHKQHERVLLSVEEVDEIVDHRPVQCPTCQEALPSELPEVLEPERQQVWEVPEIKPLVTEHRYHTVTCPHCQTPVKAERPAEVPVGAFGPGVVALVGLLHGRYRLSVREIVALLLDVFHLPICPGSVIELCRPLSGALAAPYAESQAALSRALTVTWTRRAGSRLESVAGCGWR